MLCFRCARQVLGWRPLDKDVIPCDSCGKIQTSSKYDLASREVWAQRTGGKIWCLACLGRR